MSHTRGANANTDVVSIPPKGLVKSTFACHATPHPPPHPPQDPRQVHLLLPYSLRNQVKYNLYCHAAQGAKTSINIVIPGNQGKFNH
jgi:hypothetical protein